MLPWCLLYVIDKESSDQQVPLLCKRYLAWSQCMKHTKNWDVKHGTQQQQQEKKSNNNIKFFSFMKSNQIYNRSRRGTWRSLYAKKKKKNFWDFAAVVLNVSYSCMLLLKHWHDYTSTLSAIFMTIVIPHPIHTYTGTHTNATRTFFFF